ncbi:hypothetical protein BBJ28_00002547 [Nothophytophthora sp. Chile5]|nr:hypothetical protein BBJ28_00002547 [Nothophytophthora sp. Chile5]
MGVGAAASGGEQHVAQLGRVTDRFPLMLALGSDNRNESPPAASPDPASAASPAPTDAKQLLSRVPIAGVTHLNQVDVGDSEAGDSRHKLLIAVADGNVWMATLPTRSQLGMGAMTRELVLEHGTSEPTPSAFTMDLSGPLITPTQCFDAADDVPMHERHTRKDLSATGSVERFYTLPGIQSVEYVPGVAGSPSLTLMRSLITPSTLVMSARGSSFGNGELQQTSLELDSIEGDQSTCTLCLNGQEATHRSLLAWLFPSLTDVASTVAILQGDLDGSVRFALVRLPSGQDIPNATAFQSGTLLALGQPQIDLQLKTLHSALEMQRLVGTDGELPRLAGRMHFTCPQLWNIVGVFIRSHSPDTKQGKHDSAGSKSQREDLFSLSFPLVEDRTFLLAQLSQPIEEDVPVSQLAIRAAFCQEHEPHLPVTRMGGGSNEADESSSALWNGFQWWAALATHAQRNPSFAGLWAKVAPPDSTPIELSPPSRFVMTIPHFFHSEDEDDDDEEDDDVVDKVRVERVVEFLLKLLEVPLGEASRLRRCCRTQHGKLWVMLRTFSGSVVLLRFIPAEDRQRSLSLTVQCSDVTDLSAVRLLSCSEHSRHTFLLFGEAELVRCVIQMRALVLEAIASWNEGERRGFDDEESSWEELALDVGEMLEPIASLESLLEVRSLLRFV